MISAPCVVFSGKKNKFIKEQGPSTLLKTPFIKFQILCNRLV